MARKKAKKKASSPSTAASKGTAGQAESAEAKPAEKGASSGEEKSAEKSSSSGSAGSGSQSRKKTRRGGSKKAPASSKAPEAKKEAAPRAAEKESKPDPEPKKPESAEKKEAAKPEAPAKKEPEPAPTESAEEEKPAEEQVPEEEEEERAEAEEESEEEGAEEDAEKHSERSRALPKRARTVRTVRRGAVAGAEEGAPPARSRTEARAATRRLPQNEIEEEEQKSFGEQVRDLLQTNVLGPRRPSQLEMANYSRKLGSLITAGVQLVPSLRLLSERSSSSRTLKSATFDVARDVERGSTLAEALEKHPHVYDRLFIGVVRSGEVGGILEEALRRVAEIYERRSSLKRRLRNALIYPITLVIIGIIVVCIIMTYIVPVFMDFFNRMDEELPGPTLLVIAISKHLTAFWWLWILVIGGGWLFLYYMTRTRLDWRRGWEHIKLNIPKIGTLIRLANTAQMSRTLGNLLSAGIPLWESLTVTSNTTESVLVSDSIQDACDNINEGRKLEPALRESPCFMAEFVDIVSIGEETGMLERLLLELAEDYEDEIRIQLDSVLELIKPTILILLALIVIFILVAVYLPYWNLISAIGE